MKIRALAVAFLAIWLVPAASASASDLYVDGDNLPLGNPDCRPDDPCLTIADAFTEAGTTIGADTVYVGRDADAYAPITVPDLGLTLIGGAYDFNGSAIDPWRIDGGAMPAVIFADGASPRSIRGFTLQGGTGADPDDRTMHIPSAAENVTVENNLFNEAGAALESHIVAGGEPTIRGNTIIGTQHPGAAERTFGIRLTNAGVGGAPQVIGNTITGTERAIWIEGDDTDAITVAANAIQVAGDGISPEAGIYLTEATGDVADNLITSAGDTGVTAAGIHVDIGDVVGGTLRLARNRVFGFAGPGLDLSSVDPVTISGDVIMGNGTNGSAAGISDVNDPAALTLTNATLWGHGSEGAIETDGPSGVVTLDSSIIGPGGVNADVDGAPDPTCSSSFSRGPLTTEHCSFATNAMPSFLPGASNWHLTETGNATLIDQGNPAESGGLDLDGDSLLLSGAPCSSGAGRRDIGADEAVPSRCAGPPATTKPKCPKGKKLKRVETKNGKKKKKCVKKKRKRKT